MRNRIAGLETEYGCLAKDEIAGSVVITRVRDWIFDKRRYGLLDVHHRDWDEPPGNGGFLFNGGRFYIDMGHAEVCTPECCTVRDLVVWDRAGDQLLNQALKELGYEDEVSFVRNNIDHYTGATFGCHENYLILRSTPTTEKNVHSLLAFLTLRTLFAGAGRVGSVRSYRFRRQPIEPHEMNCFQISQRADYIQNDFFEWVQGNRAIINTRDEPLADPMKYRRLHLLHGDTNVLPGALYLKAGTTRLVLDLLDADAMPSIVLSEAVDTLRHISYNPKGPWLATLTDGKQVEAVDLLGEFHTACEKEFGGRNEETDEVLKWWKFALDALAGDRLQLLGIVDWITKQHILDAFCESEGLNYADSWVAAQDLEYHNIDPERNLGLPFVVEDEAWSKPENVDPLNEPPKGCRSEKRGKLMRDIKGEDYLIDWDEIRGDGFSEEMPNPFAI
ncbi:MAG: proteasome accessory factor PafA2 family protein [Verrucomicrobiota bacterium]